MEFPSQFFEALNNEDSVAFLLFLLIAFLIGFITAWLLWGGRAKRSKIEAKKLQSELNVLRTEQAVLKEQLELKDADLLKAEREAEEAIHIATSLETEKDQLKSDLYAARVEIEKLQATARSYTHAIDDMNNQILGLKTRHAHLTEEMGKEEEALNQVAEMQSSFNATTTRLAAIEEKLESLSDENASLKVSLAEMKTQAATVVEGESPPPSVAEEIAQEDSKEKQVESARLSVEEAIGSKIPKATEGKKDDLTLIKGIGAFIEKKLNELGICSFEQISQFDDDLIKKVTQAIAFFPGRIRRDDWVGQAKRLMEIKKESPDALLPSAVFPDNPEDLKIIEGIGPKIEKLLKSAGINTWQDLSKSVVEKLQQTLNEGGDQFRLHDPSTWPMQAQMATDGEWEKLKKYQDYLIGGRDRKK